MFGLFGGISRVVPTGAHAKGRTRSKKEFARRKTRRKMASKSRARNFQNA